MKTHSTGHTFNDILFFVQPHTCTHHYTWLYLYTHLCYSPTPACPASGTCSLLQAHAIHLGMALHMAGIFVWRACHVKLHWMFYTKYTCHWVAMLKLSRHYKHCFIISKVLQAGITSVCFIEGIWVAQGQCKQNTPLLKC